MESFDVLCVGDAMIDAFLSIHHANLHCHLREEECELCLNYGEKIPLDSCHFLLGGIACRVALGLKRLGVHPSLIAEIGDDEFSQKIQNELSKEQIDTSFLKKTKEAEASFAVGIDFKGERTLLVHHVEREHNFEFTNIKTQWLFLAGPGKEWKPLYQKVGEYVQNNNVKLAFALASSQLDEMGSEIEQLAKMASALFLNKEEAEKLLGVSEKSVSELLGMFNPPAGGRNQIVSITDGKNGSYALELAGKMYSLGIVEAEIVEKTGAGDAYTAGFLAALFNNNSIEKAMQWGAVNASSVIQKMGAQAGLLTQEEIEGKLAGLPDFHAEEFK